MRENYTCQVLEVRSGDDIIAMVDLGFDGMYKKTRIRLLGVDTPDAYKSARSTQAGEVRDKVRSMTSGKLCTIHVSSMIKSSWVVTLTIPIDDNNDLNLNKYLIDQGHIYYRK